MKHLTVKQIVAAIRSSDDKLGCEVLDALYTYEFLQSEDSYIAVWMDRDNLVTPVKIGKEWTSIHRPMGSI